MSDRLLTHDATDWIRTLEELKSAGSRNARSAVEIPKSNVAVGAAVEGAQSANSDLASRVEHALRATGHSPLRNLHVLFVEGIAVLRGAVPSYYMKQLAQTAVSGVAGVSDVHNELEVVPPERVRE
jgi:osmotically-inducible protein OsmY